MASAEWCRVRWLVVVWLGCTALCGYYELDRLRQAIASPVGVLGWLTDWNSETTLPLIVLLAQGPLVFVSQRLGWHSRGQRRAVRAKSEPVSNSADHRDGYGATNGQLLATGLLLFVLSLTASAAIGCRDITVPLARGAEHVPFADLPPVYHDEFSYLLQARTFLNGRWSYPPMTVRPELFHQVHVLNQPTTASRYFPFTGLWIAPFEAMHRPILGHWLAGGIACVFFYLSLVQLTEQRWALFGGLLIAGSPGLAVFSNLLLAHHPTMMALSVFLWSMLRSKSSGGTGFLVVAGLALALAMLGRPMTAAGFALPFGVRMLFGLRVSRVMATGVPLAAGITVLLLQNVMITGHWNKSPYQLYTDTMTPRHQYGFNNVVRAEKELQQRSVGSAASVLDAYDRWATNLTPKRAIENVEQRTVASLQWSLSIVPLIFGLLMSLPALLAVRASESADRRLGIIAGQWCVFLSVISLHAVHLPYWFDGILHWHYVFETAPLLLMLTAIGFRQAAYVFASWTGARAAASWVVSLAVAGWLPGWVDCELLWGPSKVTMVIGEQAFSRVRMEQFRRLIHSASVEKPALILVDEFSRDPQLSYIINPPDLKSDVLICRQPVNGDEKALSELRQAFADRTFYRFDPQTYVLTRMAGQTTSAESVR